jgi:prepilin-type N-terminal cleavage/methylation domain-containing protein
MQKSPKGVTLIELIIVIIIIGILATMGLSHLFDPREQAITQEALVNLKLIAAAEKIYRLEQNFYTTCDNTTLINQILRLSLPVNKSNWNYKVTPANNTAFIGKAQRILDTSVVWCINQSSEEPYNTSCLW